MRQLATAEPIHKTIREISTDIKGPFEIKSRHGSIYYHEFIESDSKYHSPYFLKNRGEALQTTMSHWELHIKAENSRVVAYRSNDAKELISRDILKFLASMQTKLSYLPPYTPELNSIIERNHRTIFESANAMLLEALLPLFFWEDAVQYASLICNSG